MKKIKLFGLFLTWFFICKSSISHAQTLNCDGNNSSYHLTQVFNNYRLQTVRYAEKKDYNGIDTKLFIDVYRPGSVLDDLTNQHPVVVLVFGGGFKRGSRNSDRIVNWAEYYVKRGFVVCVPNYRLGWPGSEDNSCGTGTEADFMDAMFRAAQDIRTAVDFIKSKQNSWSINEGQVFVHSISAGALAALTWNYDHPELDDLARIERLGALASEDMDIEIKGLISVAGAMLSGFTLKDNAVPLFLHHGTCDGAVPYVESRLLDCIQYPVFEGSLNIYHKALEQLKPCVLHTYCGFKHEFELSTNNELDTEQTILHLLDESVQFIHRILCEEEMYSYDYLANDYLTFTPKDSCRNFEAHEICLPIETRYENQLDIVPSHVKFSNAIFLKSLQSMDRLVVIEFYDLMGRRLYKGDLYITKGYTKIPIPADLLDVGLHFVNIFNEEGSKRLLCKKILVEGSLLRY